jgi:hypothetical protein
MAPILTAEDVVRRIAAECDYVDGHGNVGIRLDPAAAIVRQNGEQIAGHPSVDLGPGRRNHLLTLKGYWKCVVLFAPNFCNT